MSFVQNSVVPFQRLRISPACGQVSPIVISLCYPKNLTVVLLRSVRLWEEGCSSCIGSNSVRLAILCTLTHLPSLFLVWQLFSLLGQLSYVALYPKCIVMEPLTLLPAGAIESVLQGIENFRFLFTLESFRQCIQDHVHSICSGHILWFESVAGIPGWACQPAQNTWLL